jgi:hypothetical protein
MRTSTAYFAGMGTVILAVSAGLGGGYLAANITSPPSQTVTKLERRMSADPITVSTAPAEPAAQATETNHAAAPAQEQTPQPSQTQQAPNTQPQPQTEAAAPSTDPDRGEKKPADEQKPANNVAVAQPPKPSPPSSKPAEQADEKASAPRDAFAKARDSDVKRATAEQRRAERRQRWADKRRVRQQREQELEAVEARVREETEPRQFFAGEPAGIETPRIRLFDRD